MADISVELKTLITTRKGSEIKSSIYDAIIKIYEEQLKKAGEIVHGDTKNRL